LVVTAVVCISGGVAKNFHDKKKKAKKAEEEQAGEQKDMEGQAAAEPEVDAKFYNDDCFHAMVDASEY
jgi:hypothetical protein